MAPVVAIVGPTAVGKSTLGIAIARRFGGEVVSGDAFQFYRGLDIGTAKVSPAETGGVPHHLIDVLAPDAPFSVADYQKLVRAKITELETRKVLPVLVGGSGLYVQAALYDYRFAGAGRDRTPDPLFASLGTVELYELLCSRHAELAATVEPHNRRRILRMLEIAASAPADAIDAATGKNPYYGDLVVIGLTMPRERLNARIDARVDAMMRQGLLAEVKGLHDRGIQGQSVAAIGYKELYQHLEGKLALDEAVALIKLHSHQYAKRQMTWFRNRMDATWFTVDPDAFEATVAAVINVLKDRLAPRSLPAVLFDRIAAMSVNPHMPRLRTKDIFVFQAIVAVFAAVAFVFVPDPAILQIGAAAVLAMQAIRFASRWKKNLPKNKK